MFLFGFYLDQSGAGMFSKHETLIEGSNVPERIIGGFKDKYIVEYVADEHILEQIDTYKTRSGSFNQKCFIYPTGIRGIHYFNKKGNELEF